MANDSSRPIKNQSSDKSEHSKGCALLAAVLLTVAVPVSAEDAGFFTEYIEPLLK